MILFVRETPITPSIPILTVQIEMTQVLGKWLFISIKWYKVKSKYVFSSLLKKVILKSPF